MLFQCSSTDQQMDGEVPVACIMRHSIRLDGHPSYKPHQNAAWSDEEQRPYDTPIADFALPVAQAGVLASFNLAIHMVYSSPFRRCLQTAGQVCRHLGITAIVVHYGLSESMFRVAQTKPKFGLTFLSCEEMQKELGEGVSIAAILGVPPVLSETVVETKTRFQDTLRELYRMQESACQSFLAITHGEVVSESGSVYLRPEQTIYSVDECGFVAVGKSGKVVASSKVEMFEGAMN